jgi:hypothetical protein
LWGVRGGQFPTIARLQALRGEDVPHTDYAQIVKNGRLSHR